MGEHTIREILKRRSDDTQRVIRQRRDRATKKAHRPVKSYWGVSVLLLVILTVLVAILYIGWQARMVDNRFLSNRAEIAVGKNGLYLSLQSTTQFLPNTLLAAIDPNFYNNGIFTVSPITAHLVQLYYQKDSHYSAIIKVMALQFSFSRTDILETYINDVEFGLYSGRPIRGFASASQEYFRKPFAQLQPQDMALLIALATSQDKIDPRADPKRAMELRNTVLQMDAQQDVLSQSQVDTFKKTPLDVAP